MIKSIYYKGVRGFASYCPIRKEYTIDLTNISGLPRFKAKKSEDILPQIKRHLSIWCHLQEELMAVHEQINNNTNT